MTSTGRNIFPTICIAAIVSCAVTLVAAQDFPDSGSYRILETVPAPEGQSGKEFRALATENKSQFDVTYATKIKGKLVSGKVEQTPQETKNLPPIPEMTFNNTGVIMALLLIFGLLIGWLKFGGGGALLARPPKDEITEAATAPEGWAISGQEMAGGAKDLLAQLAAMADRGEALVLLLRHCLLSVGTATQTRFARSDTERNAFARLPQTYAQREALSNILRAAELAHYGGRSVSDTDFEHVLEAGRGILGQTRGYANG